eukprot:UN03120
MESMELHVKERINLILFCECIGHLDQVYHLIGHCKEFRQISIDQCMICNFLFF